jgi:hypothetical protein
LIALLALLVMAGAGVGIWQAVEHSRPASAVAAAPAAAADQSVLMFSVDMRVPTAAGAGADGGGCSSLMTEEPSTSDDTAGGPVVSCVVWWL